MSKIFLYAIPTGRNSVGVINDAEITGDVIGCALAENGKCLTSHYSSGIEFSKHDMGLTSEWKHDIYEKEYPDGYELEWVECENLDTHEGFQAAFKLYQELEEEK